MADPPSHTTSLITPMRVLTIIVAGLLTLAAFLGVRYFDAYIPKLIETEVSKQLNGEVKSQIAQTIATDIQNRINTSHNDLRKTIDDNHRDVSSRLDNLFEIIASKPATAGSALKRGTRPRHHATLLKTLPATRELLSHVKTKVRADSKAVKPLNQGEVNDITRNLLRTFDNADVAREAWETALELASYKTATNEDAIPANPTFSDTTVSLNARDLRNAIVVNSHIVFGQCPTQLRNVRFVNCTFDIEPGSNGERFLRTLLMSNTATVTLRLDNPLGAAPGACEK